MIKNIGELKKELEAYPDDINIVIEVLYEETPVHEDLYAFYVDHVDFFNDAKEVVGSEVRLTLTPHPDRP